MTILNSSANLSGSLVVYSSQFSLGSIRNEGFSLWILRSFNFKGLGFDKFRGKGNGESLRERWKFGEKISMGDLKV